MPTVAEYLHARMLIHRPRPWLHRSRVPLNGSLRVPCPKHPRLHPPKRIVDLQSQRRLSTFSYPNHPCCFSHTIPLPRNPSQRRSRRCRYPHQLLQGTRHRRQSPSRTLTKPRCRRLLFQLKSSSSLAKILSRRSQQVQDPVQRGN